ncbi:MAG TPA: hypothetical protein VMU09_02585, partial [Acidimicrobiales bacterium]|nr:hypothetical protein [Acidimicrobiales bacterium]
LQAAPPQILELEAADNTVYRIASQCGPEHTCNTTIEKASAGSPDWYQLNAPSEIWDQILPVSPSTVYLRGTAASPAPQGSDLWRSTDGGATWQHLPDPCEKLPQYPSGGHVIAMASVGSVVALACTSEQIAPQQAGYGQYVTVSNDRGDSFGPLRPVPRLLGFDASSGIDGIALPSASTIVVTGSEGGVQTSFDGGRNWTTTLLQASSYTGGGPTEYSPPLGFETASVGHVLYPINTMWTTGDGGRSWSAYTFP